MTPIEMEYVNLAHNPVRTDAVQMDEYCLKQLLEWCKLRRVHCLHRQDWHVVTTQSVI